jgi:hypothetical protein
MEYQILLACGRSGSEPPMIVDQSTTHLNWDHVLDVADQLGIAPLLYERLRRIPWTQQFPIPHDTMGRWKNIFYWYQALNMKRFAKLQQILKTYAEEGVPVIALKGAVLASLVYPRIGLRTMGDVDLLVKQEHLGHAEHILQTRGFTPNEKYRSKEWYRQHHHHLVPYMSDDGVLEVELHHHIIPPNFPVRLPVEYLWASPRHVHIADVPCLTLSVEYLLIHLTLHAADDAYLGKLRVLYDIAETIQKHETELDWQRLLIIARTHEIQRYVYYTLWLAWDRIGAHVPPHVLQTLKGSIDHCSVQRRLVKGLLRRSIMIYDPNAQPWLIWFLRDTWADWLSREGRLRKLYSISKKLVLRYRDFSQRHEEMALAGVKGRASLVYSHYLLKKALGLKSTPSK